MHGEYNVKFRGLKFGTACTSDQPSVCLSVCLSVRRPGTCTSDINCLSVCPARQVPCDEILVFDLRALLRPSPLKTNNYECV
jgi:hypothetical protein